MINILDYTLYEKHNEYISRTAIVLDKHREHEVIKDLQWYFIELEKFRKKVNINMNCEINQWLAFIDNNRRLINMAVTKNEILEQAKEDLNYLTGEAEERRLQELRERWEMERISEINYVSAESEKRGEKRGKREGERKIIKSLFNSNMSASEIAQRTGMKLAEILKIIN